VSNTCYWWRSFWSAINIAQPKSFFSAGIQKLVERYNNCIVLQGDCVEKWYVKLLTVTSIKAVKCILHLTKNLCITHTVEHNCISPSSTVGIQLHVSALCVWAIFTLWFYLQSSYTRCVGCSFMGIGCWVGGTRSRCFNSGYHDLGLLWVNYHCCLCATTWHVYINN